MVSIIDQQFATTGAVDSDPVDVSSVTDLPVSMSTSQDSLKSTSLSASGSGRRPKLDPDQQQDVVRLYLAKTPTAEIRDRFGIGDSSLYRLLQQQGVTLRGRGPARSAAAPSQPAQPAPERGRGGRQPAGASTRRGARPRSAAPASGSGSGRGAGVQQRSGQVGQTVPGGQRYLVQFQGEAVVEASDVLGALRQVAALGSDEVLSITRED